MPEGRVINNAGTLKQEFIITDQQGNARLAFHDSGNGTPVVTQENSYYAFGLIMPNSPVALPAIPNKQLYNGGSEWQNDYSNNLPDYYQTFNRNYDAAIGRFVGVDPQAESAESLTSYNYAGNNPVMYNDPMGDKAAIKVKLGGIGSGGGGDAEQDYLNFSSGGGGDNQAGTNWQNEGAFDDNGAFSSDGGAAGNAFWNPHPSQNNATGSNNPAFWTAFTAPGQSQNYGDFASSHNPDGSLWTPPEGSTASSSAFSPGDSGSAPSSGSSTVYYAMSGGMSDIIGANQGGDPAGLLQAVAIAYGESSGNNDIKGMLAIAGVIKDRINQSGTSLYDPNWALHTSYGKNGTSGGSVVGNYNVVNGKGPGGEAYTTVMGLGLDYIENQSTNAGLHALINAFSNQGWGADPSNPNGYADTGRYFWIATGSLNSPTSQYNSATMVITLTLPSGTTFYRPR
jgi:RHS repeat-associated protein